MSPELEGLRLRITGTAAGLTAAIDAAKQKVSGLFQSIARMKANIPNPIANEKFVGPQIPLDPFRAFRATTTSAQESLNKLKQTASNTESQFASMNLGGIVAKLTAVVGAAGLASKAIDLSSQAEQTQISMQVMLGSAEKARAMIDQLRTLAASTPLELKGLTENAKLMLGFGVNSKQVVENLRMLGDITGGNAEKMHLLSLAFSQSSAAGRLMGQDLLQMINAGFNPLQEISEKTGISLTDLKKRMEDGQISFAAVREAFRSATSEGGRFNGMLEEQSKTFAGRVGKMRDAFQVLLVKVGEQVLPILAKFADQNTAVIQTMSSLSASSLQTGLQIAAFVTTFGTLLAVIPRVVAGFRAIATASAVAQAFGGPAGWAALAASLAIAAGATMAVEQAFNGVSDAARRASENVQAASGEVTNNAEAQQRIRAALDAASQKSKTLLDQEASVLRDKKKLLEEQLSAVDANLSSQKESLKLALEESKARRDKAIAEIDKRFADDPGEFATQRRAAEANVFEKAFKGGVAGITDHFAEGIKESEKNAESLRERLKEIGTTLEENSTHWQNMAEATRKANQSPLDTLKQNLSSLAEQVRQGGLELSVFNKASETAVKSYRSEIDRGKNDPNSQSLQFAGIVAGSQEDVQSKFRFLNQYASIGPDSKEDEANTILKDILAELQVANANPTVTL